MPAVCTAAERYVFDVFDRESGLGNSTVTRIVRDRHGALWVGTENGLYRYDGYRFLAFTTANGLPSNRITAIHETPDGTLWVGTLEGLSWREGTGFRRSANEVMRGPIAPQAIASDSTGRVFVAGRGGIALTATPPPGGDLQVSFLPWPGSVPRKRSTSVYATSPDQVWFGCDVAICRWNGKEVQIWDTNSGVPAQRWDLFLKDRSGNLWARSRESLIELPSGTDRFQPVGPDLPGPISIFPELATDRNGRILVTDNRGLTIGDGGGWRRVTEKQGLPASFVTAVLQDAEGSVWLGTYGAGLARWAGYETCRSFTVMEGLAGSSILSLLEDPAADMWAGTAGGLSHGVYSRGTWNWSEVPIPGVGWAISLARSGDGVIWMVSDGHFVLGYDPVRHISRRLGPFREGPFDLRADSAGRLWIADSGGVTVASTRPRVQVLEKIRPPGATETTPFTSTREDARGDLWFGSYSGLFRRSRDRWFHYDTSNGLKSNRIADLALSPEGDLWVTYVEPKGADRVQVVGDRMQVENFDRSKGLTSDRVNSVAFDRQGQLWVLNDHGAEVRRGNRWIQYSRADGLLTSGSTGRAFSASADGAIWIGSERGLSRLLPATGADTPAEPLSVQFSEVRIGNKTIDPGLTSLIEVAPQNFEASFSALVLGHVREVQYRYRIAGFDDRWQETVQPVARLDYPHPGRYRLEVQARMDGQPWQGPAAIFELDVRPRWYETLLFRGVVLGLLCFAVWRLEKYRQRRAATTRQALARMVEERTDQLRESEQRFRTMADSAPVMIWVAGSDKALTFFNKTWLDFVGRTMEQELDKGWTASVHPDDLDRCLASYSSAFESRETFHMEARLRRADGEYRWVLCTGVPRFAPDGVFEGYIGSNIDITDMRRAQEETLARQKLESMGLLAGGIAHDFNNLLGCILTTSELVVSELPAGSPGIDGVMAIQSVAERGAELVRQMMSYAGRENPSFERVDVGQLVGEIVQLLKLSISKSAILRVDVPEALPAVWANAAQIRQVVMNLVINASEALGEKEGVISVTLAHVPVGPGRGRIRLEVSDTGCGMTEEIRSKMFDPFFTTKFPGRGLGLAAVQGIIRSHGADLDVATAPGMGCRIEVQLPCASEPEQLSHQAFQPAGDGATLSGTILVVEDEDTLRDAVSRMLRKKDFNVIAAGDGKSALELFRINASVIDVAIVDMTLPGMSGREVLEEFRRIQPDLKVIITSAYDEDHAFSTMGELQPWLYIRKPYHFSELMKLLRKVCLERDGTAAMGADGL